MQKHIHDNHVKNGEDGRTFAWNKGLTKETDERVARNAKHVSEGFRKRIDEGYVNPTWTDEYWTKERRKEKSELKKKLYQEHPEKHPNRKLAGNRKKMTYPEKVVFDWLIEHKIEFEHQYLFKSNQFTRYVDFYIPEKNLFIEVDGRYWHIKNLQNDLNKDEDAKQHGFITERISASESIVSRLESIFDK